MGDITEIAADAIVNPSNASLVLGSGVSGAIAAKGGPSIQEQMGKIGGCPVGSAVVTGAGTLKARHVIHAVGPQMGEGDEDNKLHNATLASLKKAEELKIGSIVFPAISTGVFGFPVERCAAIMISTALDHFATGSPRSLNRVIFCLWGKESFETFNKALDWLMPQM
ncbi:MAG: macro domain-containing protein [Nitrospinae bacterium]|nr:macro domain-containing protein [Nitrospinota bacterium]